MTRPFAELTKELSPERRERIHPGEHFAEELQDCGMSARELARELKVPVTRVTEILQGRRGISGDV